MFKVSFLDTFKVISVRVLKDNYSYIVQDGTECFVIDCVEPNKIMQHVSFSNIKAIFTTHRHSDHAGGNKQLLSLLPKIPQYGGYLCGNKKIENNQEIKPFKYSDLSIICLHTPCHTREHFCYLVKKKENNFCIFTGDTLFIGGCGRFFEGTPQEMYNALFNIIGRYEKKMLLFPGHEYSLKNWMFGLIVEPENLFLKKKIEEAKKEKFFFSVPSCLYDEFKTNPFMRVDKKKVQSFCKTEDCIEAMKYLREYKNRI